MAFSEYKNIGQVQKEFSIRSQFKNFIVAEPVSPSDTFITEFEFTLTHIPVFRSESARTEALIFPILREVYKTYSDNFALWVQEPISVDVKLNGTPDYLIASKSPLGITVFTYPLLAIVEA